MSRVRLLPASCILLVLCLPSNLLAEVQWTWQFGTESGSFVTDGDFEDTNGAFEFTFLSFEVATSSLPTNVGATYFDQDPLSSFLWDGTQVTQFRRSNGALVNGSNFENSSDGGFYVLSVPDLPEGTLLDVMENTLVEGLLTVAPSRPSITEVPVSGSVGTLTLIGALSVLSILFLRRRA